MAETRKISLNRVSVAIQLFALLVVVVHVFHEESAMALRGFQNESGEQKTKSPPSIESWQTEVEQEEETSPSYILDSWQPKSKARFCDPETTIEESLYKSQSGEDKELMKYFNNLCEGTYMEMGALDGVRFSNTHVFHFGLQWNGVMVEASPRNYESLITKRPDEIANVHAGVCEQSKPLHWVEGRNAAVGGFLEFATQEFQNLWWTEKAIQNAKMVQCKPLKDIVSETMGPRAFFDFFSLDIEGAEYTALASLDFDQVSFGMVIVESDSMSSQRKNMAILTLMEANGYRFLQEFERSYWFINRDFANIYSHLIYQEAE